MDGFPKGARRTDLRSAIKKTMEFFDNAPKERIEELVRQTRERLASEGEGETPELEAWPITPPRKAPKK